MFSTNKKKTTTAENKKGQPIMSEAAHDIFKESSQTYYYSSRFFGGDIRNAVTQLYAFVRVADDYVDAIPQNHADFNQFRDEYEGTTPPRQIVESFHYLERKYNFDPSWPTAFLDSMEQDFNKQEYKSMEETREYMYGSAEVIGCMLCRIFGVPENAHEGAKNLGRGMQYINFLRDIPEDLEYGRIYIPQNILSDYGLDSLQETYTRKNSNAFSKMMRDELSRGQQWLRRGREDFDVLPVRVRIAVETATEMYSWTAEKIKENPFVIYQKKVKPSIYRILFTGLKRSIYD